MYHGAKTQSVFINPNVKLKKEELKTELEHRLFTIYSRDTEIYNAIVEGNPEVKELWVKIIEADLKEQEKQQKVLFEK